MNKYSLDSIFNRPCRFKLKSGKEVFGVIWKNQDQIFFSSLEGYRIIADSKNEDQCNSTATIIQEEDILGAEIIPAIAS